MTRNLIWWMSLALGLLAMGTLACGGSKGGGKSDRGACSVDIESAACQSCLLQTAGCVERSCPTEVAAADQCEQSCGNDDECIADQCTEEEMAVYNCMGEKCASSFEYCFADDLDPDGLEED